MTNVIEDFDVIEFAQSDLWRASVHEAGHAAYCISNGIEILSASVYVTEPSDAQNLFGRVYHLAGDETADIELLAGICLAGPIAECLVIGGPSALGGNDMLKVKRLLRERGRSVDDSIGPLVRSTMDSMIALRNDIVILAVALCQRYTITHDDALEVLQQYRGKIAEYNIFGEVTA